MVGAPFNHLGDMLSFLVDGHGTDDSALRRWGHHLNLDGARLGNLAVQFLQFSGILLRDRPEVERGKEPTGDIVTFRIRAGKICPHFMAFTAARLPLANICMTSNNLIRVKFINRTNTFFFLL